MTQVSKRIISKDKTERIFDIFLNTLFKIRSKKDMAEFLRCYLTPTEQIMLSKRIAIAFLLAKKHDYGTISDKLKVSTSTIRNVAISYKYNDVFKATVDRSLRDDNINNFVELIAEQLVGVFATASKGGGSWNYAKKKLSGRRKDKTL
jgi:uncharacterized protein YerC